MVDFIIMLMVLAVILFHLHVRRREMMMIPMVPFEFWTYYRFMKKIFLGIQYEIYMFDACQMNNNIPF